MTLVAAGVVIAIAAGIAWQAARSTEFGASMGFWLAGLAVAGVAGWAFGGLELALFTASAYVVLAAAGQVYALQRDAWEIGLWGVFAAIGLVGVMALADLKTGAFVLAGTVILFSAMKVLASSRLVHAAVWLAGVLIGIALIFLSLGAEFLAAIQILVYVGAVLTLFLFTIMLTIPEEDVNLEGLKAPPGVTISKPSDLNPGVPAFGVGPYKGFSDTNPRKPVDAPATLYGVSLTDGVFGTDDTVRRKSQKKEEGN